MNTKWFINLNIGAKTTEYLFKSTGVSLLTVVIFRDIFIFILFNLHLLTQDIKLISDRIKGKNPKLKIFQ